nr:hypothetical protein [Saprospiraceae bacterium]
MKITEKDRKKLLNAIPMIAAYVAFADGELDKKEVDSAKRIANLRRFNSKVEPAVRRYYTEVFEQFDDRFLELVHNLPNDEEERSAYLEKEIAKMNGIIQKLDPLHALQLLKSFKSFAEHVARAEGGLLAMGTYGPRQDKARKLEMLTDVDSL